MVVLLGGYPHSSTRLDICLPAARPKVSLLVYSTHQVKGNGRGTELDKSFFSCECGRMGLGRESLAHVYREFRHA